jgi:hypothetical protein
MEERRKGRGGLCGGVHGLFKIRTTDDLPQSTLMTATDLRLRLQISLRMRVQASSPYDRGNSQPARGSILPIFM